jgi:TolA-binding protein
MEKILTLLVGILIALGGWSLSRTFELSTGQAVLQNKVEKLEMQIRLTEEKIHEMFDMDKEIIEQHKKLFEKLKKSNKGYN